MKKEYINPTITIREFEIHPVMFETSPHNLPEEIILPVDDDNWEEFGEAD